MLKSRLREPGQCIQQTADREVKTLLGCESGSILWKRLGWILSSRLKIPDPQLDTVMGAKEASNTQMHPHSEPPPNIYTYLSSEGRGD